MKTNRTFNAAAAMAAALASLTTADAAVHVLPDFTRPAGGASVEDIVDFIPSAGSTLWSNAPPNAITGDNSVYLTVTVSWAPSASIGTLCAEQSKALLII